MSGVGAQAAGEVGLTEGRLSDPSLCDPPEDPRLKPWNASHKHVLHLPTVFHHLPHLLAKESSLQPAVRVGQGRTGGRGRAGRARGGRGAMPAPCPVSTLRAPAVSVVMGIPSVRREVHSYLTDTLHSLISELSPQEKEDSVIVVLIAEASGLGRGVGGTFRGGTRHKITRRRNENRATFQRKKLREVQFHSQIYR